jgi:hypothetical protein
MDAPLVPSKYLSVMSPFSLPPTQLWARTVIARLGLRAVYSSKVQVPQT